MKRNKDEGKVIEVPILSVYDRRNATEMHCDAIKVGFRAILLQRKEDGKFHPIFYFSKRTTDYESKYHSFELETLAIIYALRRFRIYLQGITFKIVTGYNLLTLTLNRNDINPRIAWWALKLENFNYALEPRKEGRMEHVDALSSNIWMLEENTFEQNLSICPYKDLNKVRSLLESGKLKFYEMKNGFVYRKLGDRVLFYVLGNIFCVCIMMRLVMWLVIR